MIVLFGVSSVLAIDIQLSVGKFHGDMIRMWESYRGLSCWTQSSRNPSTLECQLGRLEDGNARSNQDAKGVAGSTFGCSSISIQKDTEPEEPSGESYSHITVLVTDNFS